MSTYAEHIQQTKSEKITLCQIFPSKRVISWTSEGSNVYSRLEPIFISDVAVDGVSLTLAASSSVSAGEFFYDDVAGKLWIELSDSSDPSASDVYLTVKYTFSTLPIDLPHDLNSGSEVHWDGRLSSFSAIKFELDHEATGIALESGTNVTIENTDRGLDSVYDTLFWENKTVRLWMWNSNLPIGEATQIFDGRIQDKSFANSGSGSTIKFKCRDLIYSLRQPVNTGTYSGADGSVPDSFLGTAKRRIYGQFQNLQCVPTDAILSGFSMSGTISGTAGSSTVTGVSTAFLDELSPGDKVIVVVQNGDELEIDVASVESDTSFTASTLLASNFGALSAVNSPERPWRKKNRVWNIAGHKLRAPSTTIASVQQDNRITLTDATDFLAGDRIDVDGETAVIKRVIGNQLVLRQNLQTTPSPSDAVTKEPVTSAYINTSTAVITRDFTVLNTTESDVVFEDDAEFNIAPEKTVTGSWTFTSGSRNISLTGQDALNFLQPRDWIRSTDITHTVWYEVLSVDQSSVVLRVPYAGSTTTTGAQVKNPDLIGDETFITVDCVGKESAGGVWLKTASDAVKDLIENDAGELVDDSSFATAKDEGPYILSYAIPKELESDSPEIKKAISDINQSVFGAAYQTLEFRAAYNILSPEKPSTLEEITDDEIVGTFSVNSQNDIKRKVTVNYRHFFDRFTESDTSKKAEYDSVFVQRAIGTEDTLTRDVYLFNDADANSIAERINYYGSLSQSVVKFKTKRQFSTKLLTEKLYIAFERLYNRFGSTTPRKIGLITSISKTNDTTSVEMIDLGNVFNRTMSIADNSALDFSSASDEQKLFNCYIVDNDTETPDTTNDELLGCNTIG